MITISCLDKVVGYQPVSSCDVTMITNRQVLGLLPRALGALPQDLFSDLLFFNFLLKKNSPFFLL